MASVLYACYVRDSLYTYTAGRCNNDNVHLYIVFVTVTVMIHIIRINVYSMYSRTSVLKDCLIGHKDMVSQGKKSLVTGSFTLKCSMFCQNLVVKTGDLSWQWSPKTGFTVFTTQKSATVCVSRCTSIFPHCNWEDIL